MNENMLEHMEQLAIELNQSVRCVYDLSVDSPNDSCPCLIERYGISSPGYEIIYRLTMRSVLEIRVCDFILKGEE